MDNSLEKLVLNDEETLTEVVNCLAKHIPINSQGAGDARSLFKILVRAASKQDTIENTSQELKNFIIFTVHQPEEKLTTPLKILPILIFRNV